LEWGNASNLTGLDIKKNIVTGFIGSGLITDNGAVWKSSTITDNVFWNNAYNVPFQNWEGVTMLAAGNTVTNNRETNPILNANYISSIPGVGYQASGVINPPPPPVIVSDTTKCTVIQHGPNLTRNIVTYFVKRADGLLYDSNGKKRDIILYKNPAGVWYYKTPTGWVKLF